MRILRTIEDAIQVANDCLSKYQKGKQPTLDGMKKFPPQLSGPWDIHAVEPTMKYIFEKLHHSCYMLCVIDGKGELIKLESTTTAPTFKPLLTKLSKTLKAKKRKTLLKTIKSKEWRVMQCVVKPFSGTTTKEYEQFISELPELPDGVYIMNLTDAVILRKDGTEPWHMVSSKSLGEYKYDKYLPILSTSGQEGFWDIPIPNYDDIRLIQGRDKIGTPELDWNSKQEVAVFRGGPTGCGYTSETNQRLKLATMRSPDLNVGIVSTTSSLKFDPKHGLGQMTEEIKPVGFLDLITEQSKYKYIIHVDGNVAAYRLLKSMLTGSAILRVESEYILWIDHLIKAGVHYIPVKHDLSNLQEVVNWCKKNDSKVKKIAEAGYDFAKKVLTKQYVQDSFAKLLWKL